MENPSVDSFIHSDPSVIYYVFSEFRREFEVADREGQGKYIKGYLELS